MILLSSEMNCKSSKFSSAFFTANHYLCIRDIIFFVEGLQHIVNEDKVTGKQAMMRQMQVVQNTEEGKLSARQTSKIQYFPAVTPETNHKRVTSGTALNTETYQTHYAPSWKPPNTQSCPPPAQHLQQNAGRTRAPRALLGHRRGHRPGTSHQAAGPACWTASWGRDFMRISAALKAAVMSEKNFFQRTVPLPQKKGLSLFLYKYVYYLTLENNSSITSMQNQTRWRAESGKKK